jgi:biopolymer transport protein ExbB
MSFDLLHIWAAMGPLSKLIAGALLLMGVASIAIFVERTWSLSKSASASRAFALAVAAPLEDGDLARVVELSSEHRRSALARLFGATLDRYLRALAKGDSEVDALDKAKAEAERRKEVVSSELRAGMAVVATVGSIAPFVGLLGTVVGIIAAFQGIAATGSGGLGAVSVGIAEALVETALGLLIAIPAVVFFNVLSQRIGKVEQALGRGVGELIDDLGRRSGTAPLAARSSEPEADRDEPTSPAAPRAKANGARPRLATA